MMSVIGQIVCGWLLADLLSGLVHWFEDRVPAASDSWFGRHFITPNRLHHEKPLAMFGQGFVERNWTTWLVVAALGLAWWAVAGLSVMLVVAAAGGALTYEVHRLAHAPKLASRWVKVIQQTGIIQSPKAHSRHHAPPQDRNYCILTDLINPILDDLGVWRKLESGLDRIGMPPSRGA